MKVGEYDGMEIRFNIPTIPDGKILQVITNHSLKVNFVNTRIVFTGASDHIKISLVCGDDLAQPWEVYRWSGNSAGDVRILMHRKFVTVYFDETWVYTFSTDYADYSDPATLTLEANWSVNIFNVCVSELCDWREAIFIDIDSNPASAIDSIIQERPINIMGQSDGSLAFYYDPLVRPQVTLNDYYIREHDVEYGASPQAASDTIVYYADVRVLVDPDAARDVGLSTRILRVPNLDNGAMRAAQAINLRARQSREMHRFSTRLYPAIQIGDQINIAYTMPGPQRTITESLIVESAGYQFGSKFNEMVIQARSAATIFSPFPRE